MAGWSIRIDDTVSAVFVGGRAVLLDGSLTEIVGAQRTGRFLRAARHAPAKAHDDKELAGVR